MVTRLASLVLALAALVVLASGCASDNTASVQPYALCSMPDDCVFAAECDAQVIGAFEFDPSGNTEMFVAIEVHNQLTNNADEKTTGHVNTHDAHFESYSVSYGGAPGLVSGSTGEIPASSSSTQQVIPAEGTSVVGVYPFPQSVVADLNAGGAVPVSPDYVTVQVTVNLKGRYDDGSKWEAPFEFPVRLSLGGIGFSCPATTPTPTAACPSLFQIPHGKPTCE